MSRVIHARLDDETEVVRSELTRRLGWSDSRIVREGVKSLAVLLVPKRKRRIVSLGKFKSGVPDLGSNKRHIEWVGA